MIAQQLGAVLARERSELPQSARLRDDHAATFRTPRARKWIWQVYLACGVVMLTAIQFVPRGIANDVMYLIMGASCVGAIVAGLLLHRPRRRLPWLLMSLGQFLWVVGDAFDSWYQDVDHINVYPSAADAFYLSAYPVLAVGLLLLIRGRRPRRDIAALLDSATVTVGLGVLSWVLLAHPTLDASHQSFAAAAVSVAYPMADILMAGMLIRLVMTPGGRTASFRLLFGAVTLLIAGDTMSAALGLWSLTSSNAYDVVWLASYAAWGAAALHPSMPRLSEPSTGVDLRFTRGRLVALAVASLIAPGTLIVERITGTVIDIWAAAAGSVVVFLLVIGRMNVAITQIVAANRDRDVLQMELAYQAAHDSLTNLPNRAQAMDAIETALHRAQRAGTMCGLLFVDLDGFKSVNDAYGHGVGDEVLRTSAQRLQGDVRAGDLIARLGGDEFVVLLESLGNESEALQIAQRLIASLSAPMTIEAAPLARIGASVGMAISRDGFTDPHRLLHEADVAVYRAKAAGRGRVEIFDDALRRELELHGELEDAIRFAIDHEELVLHYQPIIDLGTNTVRGFEALVRWQRPGHGLLLPGQFIPAAESSTLICDIDRWVLRRAARQMAEWNALGGSATISVNISSRHISLSRIVTDVQDALATSGLPAGQLALEITETVLADDLLAPHHCQQLRELGVAISIDDWGTGYNSLARLRHLPVDAIKIDQTFLDSRDKSNEIMLRLMIQAGHAFGMPVVVEGVETRHQLDLLRALGCEFAQGNYFSRPVPAEQGVVALGV